MKKIFCDSCDTQIDRRVDTIERSIVMPGVNFKLRILTAQPNAADTPDLCKKCLSNAVRQAIGDPDKVSA